MEDRELRVGVHRLLCGWQCVFPVKLAFAVLVTSALSSLGSPPDSLPF